MGKLCVAFCTEDLHPPEGAEVKPRFNNALYMHMCVSTEAISVEAASNELTSVRQMCAWHPDVAPKFLTRCTFILRDAARSSRRILSRGWGAGETLDSILGLFVHWRMSPGQMIQHSTDLRRLYNECCSVAANDAAVSTVFSHMLAAKHRIEPYCTPLSRCILNPSGLLAFLMKVAVVRKDRL